MGTARSAGRVIGVLVLAQMVLSFLVNFVLMAPVFAAPGFLVNAAGHSLRFGVAVLIGLAAGVLSVGIAIAAFPVFRQRSQAMALWFAALAVVGFSVTAVENISLMSLLSLSEAYAKASAAQGDLFQALRVVVASARNWAHYTGLIVAGGELFVLYGALFRFAMVPRVLAGFGLAAVLLQITAVAMPLFGHDVVFPLLMPLGLCHLALALWLIAKGLRGSTEPQNGRNAA
ncbi:MAG: DUF4386 domain-containing protein [Acidobacteriia bacterium]|nr:DUF4386 domain-containing protein [Terriglobia bacterium]